MKVFSLLEVNEFTRRVIALNFSETIWITAEIGQISVSKAQHVYLSLLEKEETAIVAQIDAVIWADAFRRIQYQLGGAADSILQAGHTIKFKGRLDFHERYGLKILIEEIDATYTFGALALQRQQYLLKLQALNLIERNRQLPLAAVPQRLAVISGEQAAGLQDFKAHLTENAAGYHFDITIFAANVQGYLAENEIPKQLAQIARQADLYDCVCIIRGGGAKLDLLAFDSWPICVAIAEMPLPVLVGIGHDIDATLADVVAHTSVKTPTALADFLITQLREFERGIGQMGHFIKEKAAQMLYTEGGHLADTLQWVTQLSQQRTQQGHQQVVQLEASLSQAWRHKQTYALMELKNTEKLLELMQLETALKRGFALVRQNGALISRVSGLDVDMVLQTELQDGIVESVVKAIIPNQKK